VWMLVSYLKSIAVAVNESTFSGNADLGRQLFADNCARCHRVASEGGSLGPDLTQVTARRSRSALVDAIRNPGAEIGSRYRPVLITDASGQLVQGTLKSEDAFSLQIMDLQQQLRGFTKASLRSLERLSESLMPRFSDNELSEVDIENLLTYLQVQQ